MLAAALAAGCSHVQYAASSGPSAAAGTTAAGTAGLTVSTSSAVAIAFLLTLGVVDYVNNPRPFPSPTALLPANTPPVPEMATGRLISEQDCSRPVDLSLGNLRCR
jgi:hypothetical protein